MITTDVDTQLAFYREFLMGRGRFDPRDFGVDMDRADFIDACVGAFHDIYRDTITIDELLLHPSEASRFVSDVRRQHVWYDVPDDIILRSIMIRRKNPGG